MEAQLQIRQVGASSMYNRPRLDDFTPLYLPTGLQNAMEVQDYMKDLFDWQKDIKKKDKTILKHGDPAPVRPPAAKAATAPPPPPVPAAAARQLLSSSSDSGLPAPRGRAVTGQVSHAPAALQAPGILPAAMRHAAASAMQPPPQGSGTAPAPAAKAAIKKRKKKVKGLPGDAKLGATAASHTYAAYKKWDTFDIDAALKSDDDEEASEYESGSEEEEQAAAAAPAAATSAPSTVAAASASPATLSTLPPARAVNPSTTSGTSVTIAPREPLTSSDLSERSTVRTAAPAAPHPSSATPSAAPPASHPAAVTAAEREVPPVRSQEPQTSEAWRARGNDLFKVRHGACLQDQVMGLA